MNNHLYVINGVARDLSSETPKVFHILGDDPFAGAPEWADDIRTSTLFGPCWCDVSGLMYKPVKGGDFDFEHRSAAADAKFMNNPAGGSMKLGDVVATRIIGGGER